VESDARDLGSPFVLRAAFVASADYSVREAAQLLGISPAEVRRCLEEGILNAPSAPVSSVRLNFQDLVLLKRAAALMSERVRPHRVRKALRRLRADSVRPLSGIELTAEGKQLVARSGGTLWNVESSQLLLDFSNPLFLPPTQLHPRPKVDEGHTAEDWYAVGCECEDSNPKEAARCYDRALTLDPFHPEALLNRGRLFHAEGALVDSERCFREAAKAPEVKGLALFNLGVALEDQGRTREALEAYEAAARLPESASDAHFNAARLYERTGQRTQALRHLREYRALLRK